MRRTSTSVSAIGKLSRVGSKSSLKVDSTPAQSISEPDVPSPVAESPMREAAAAEESPVIVSPLGPSPLHQSTTAQEAPSVQPSPQPALVPALEPGTITASPEGSEAPLVPEQSKPQSQVEASSMEPPAAVPTTSAVKSQEATPAEPPAVPAPAPAPAPSAPGSSGSTSTVGQSGAVVPALTAIGDLPVSPSILPPGPTGPIAEKKGPDYFGFSDEQTLAPDWAGTAHAAPPVPQVISAATEEKHGPVRAGTNHAEAYAWGTEISISPKQSMASFADRRDEGFQPARTSRAVTRASSKTSLTSSSFGEVVVATGGKRVAVSLERGEGEGRRGRSPGPNVRVTVEDPYSDPFADPPPDPKPTPKVTPKATPKAAPAAKMPALSPIESLDTPALEIAANDAEWSGPVSIPLPPQREVIASKVVQDIPSGYVLGDSATSDQDGARHETDERQPLLQRSSTASLGGNGKVNAYNDASSRAAIPFPTGSISPELASTYSIENVGWKEHALPDSTSYYVHSSICVVTDIDLRNAQKLRAIMEYLKRFPSEVATPPQGWELWIRETGKTKKDFKLIKNWVNHKARILSFDPPPTISGDSLPDQINDDDRLDMEYRYWMYLEAHPAHAPLISDSRAEALDALSWSYTDSLLPASRSVAPPFAPQECQELMTLLRSVDGVNSTVVVQTHLVARVMIRVVQWRQYHYRPKKPLPKDAINGLRRPQHRTRIGRILADILVSVLCLGIPYLFLNRSRRQRVDMESGVRSSGPMFVISACACLVAAIILSASVTFISLPGLDDISRIAGLLAILFSASSMISAVVALLQYKADAERTMVYVGGEGLVLLTRRSIIMSLPLVFLAWATITFVSGVTYYSFRDTILTGRFALRNPFEDHTHWTMVGTAGGISGLLVISALLAHA